MGQTDIIVRCQLVSKSVCSRIFYRYSATRPNFVNVKCSPSQVGCPQSKSAICGVTIATIVSKFVSQSPSLLLVIPRPWAGMRSNPRRATPGQSTSPCRSPWFYSTRDILRGKEARPCSGPIHTQYSTISGSKLLVRPNSHLAAPTFLSALPHEFRNRSRENRETERWGDNHQARKDVRRRSLPRGGGAGGVRRDRPSIGETLFVCCKMLHSLC